MAEDDGSLTKIKQTESCSGDRASGAPRTRGRWSGAAPRGCCGKCPAERGWGGCAGLRPRARRGGCLKIYLNQNFVRLL